MFPERLVGSPDKMCYKLCLHPSQVPPHHLLNTSSTLPQHLNTSPTSSTLPNTSTGPQHLNTFPTPLHLLNSSPTLPQHLLNTSPTIPQHLPITSSTPTQHFPSMFPSGQTSQPDPLESRYTRSTCYSFSRHIYPKRQTK